MNQTITSALGLPKEWEEKNIDEVIDALKANETVSDAVLYHLNSLKKTEFHIEECEITEYERKIFWSGMEMSRILLNAQRNNDLNSKTWIYKMFMEAKATEEDTKRTRRPKR